MRFFRRITRQFAGECLMIVGGIGGAFIGALVHDMLSVSLVTGMLGGATLGLAIGLVWGLLWDERHKRKTKVARTATEEPLQPTPRCL